MTELHKKDGKIILSHNNHTLASVVEDLLNYETDYIKYVSEKELNNLYAPPEGHYNQLFLALPVYLRNKDKEAGNPLTMVFVKNGMVTFSEGDVLENYVLDESRFFFDFDVDHSDANSPYYTDYHFEDSDKAFGAWKAKYNYDEIFEAFYLDGSGDLAGFSGFFFKKD